MGLRYLFLPLCICVLSPFARKHIDTEKKDTGEHKPLIAMYKTFALRHGCLPACLGSNFFGIDAVEFDSACTSWHIGSPCQACHLEEKIGLHTRQHLMPLVLHVGALPGRPWYRHACATDCISYPNRIEAHLLSSSRLGGFQREAVMILAICDKYNVPVVVGQWAESAEGLADRIAQQGPATGDSVWPHLVQLLQKEPIIQGQGALQARLTGKDHQAKTVPALFLEHLHQVFDVAFGACQPVGDDVLREHAARDVQHDHEVASLAVHLLPLLPPLWLHQRQH